MERRKFLKNGFWASIALGFSSFIYAWQIEPFWLEFVKVKMPIKNLPDNLVGKLLMQISDIHVGNRFDYQYIINSFKKAQKLNPDFVCYTGDFVNYENEEQFTQLSHVMKHVVKGKLGTIGVLGNHDYGKDWAEINVVNKILSILNKSGVKILRNEQQNIDGLNFIGIDDYWAINFKPENVMNSFDKNLANIALSHNPDTCDLDIWNGYDSWILSGHTHGGQVKPPFLPPPMIPVINKKYSSGKFNLSNGRSLYINRALGHLHQVRFLVRPEITVFTLEKA